MNSFDKLKIVASIDHIKITYDGQFVTTTQDGIVISKKYETKKPFELCIIANERHRELVIEFTGKLLRDRYVELITHHNIRYCFERINAMGFCVLDAESIIKYGEVVKCDVTKDIEYTGTIPHIENHIKMNLKSNDKWRISKYRGGNGFVLAKNVTTSRYKIRISIYNKKVEMERANNSAFLDSLENPQTVLMAYENKIRVELNLVSRQAIKTLLNINNTSLVSVLTSDANPLIETFNSALIASSNKASFRDISSKDFIEIVSSNKTLKLDEVGRLAMLALVGGDLNIIETIIREHTSKNISVH